MSQPKSWRVGELARETGLTVRTLHYYDEIGLLRPSGRTESGYRLYAAADIGRLQQIRSLRQLGLSLEEVRDWLDRPDFSARRVLRMHIALLNEQIALERDLVGRLEALAGWLDGGQEASAEELIGVIQIMDNVEKYYTPEQLEQLKARREHVGEERIRQVEHEWPALIAEVKAEMEKGTDPSDPRVRELARRWQGLVNEFTGGDPGIARSLANLYQNEPSVRQYSGVDTAVFAYIARAMKG